MPNLAGLARLKALKFGGATGHRIDFGTPSAWTGLTSLSALMLVQPTTLTSGRTLLAKCAGSQVSGYKLSLNGTTGSLRFEATAATTSTVYTTNTNPLAGLNQWVWVGFAFDPSVSPNVRIYSARRGRALREETYGTTTDQVGGYTIDTSANQLVLCNNSGASSSFQGSAAFLGFWSEVKALASLNQVRDAVDAYPFLELPPARIYAIPGFPGDQAGSGRCHNFAASGGTNGVTSGAVLTDGPLPMLRYTSPAAKGNTIAPATKLIVTVQPQNTVVGQPMATIIVTAQNASNEIDPAYTSNIVLAWGTNPNSAPAPAGTLTVAAVAGSASFTDILVNTLQTAATFGFTSGSLTSATSSTFNITAPSASGGHDLLANGWLVITG
jgi:hypothetical protein